MFDSGNSGNDRPDVSERYAGAVSTSNLTAPPEWRPTDAYVLVASGLGRAGLGGALMRLQTEWQRTAKPPRAKPPTLAQIVAKLPLIKTGEAHGRTIRGPDLERAKRMHAEALKAIPSWYDAELRMVKNRMRDMPKVRDHLCVWLYGEEFVRIRDELAAFPDRKADRLEFNRAEAIVAETVMYWLDDTCHTCHGARWQVVPNTTRLSNRKCTACDGTGLQREPTGHGQQMLDYMRQCIYDWRQSTSAQLANFKAGKMRYRKAEPPSSK